ncbi:dirigent protein 22-like [Argentina anserina]|uniref:dirigent protein 22-like n=1 Tax=Argentina anserina TaxID=57926 RepID=UPI0021765164|nr:dirigent protein 22-like [Potentilla anserina]
MAFNLTSKLTQRFLPPLLLLVFTISLAEANTILKETRLVLYFQDFTAGPNISNIAVAGIAGKEWSFTQFGTIYVTDDAMTQGPKLTSPVVGRAQGIKVASALNGRNTLVLVSLVFTNLKYNGSTLELQGNSKNFEPVREVAVVAGTGKFRFARGYATFETFFLDPATSYAVIRCNVTVQHYHL